MAEHPGETRRREPANPNESPIERGEAFASRSRAAFLGLALGDAYGRPLEFLHDASVRTAPVSLDPLRFRWTDDTLMSLYLAEAVVEVRSGGPSDDDRWGRSIGEAFVRWLDDPLTPYTAPGRTCLAGARNFREHGDWRRSGLAGQDGCGAVMRIVPLPIALGSDELERPAAISAELTHRGADAVESAIAGSWMVRQLLEGRPLGRELVTEAIERLRREWGRGGDVAGSLGDALAVADGKGEWLDERGVRPGDGGWRSGSALGLAVAAALRWGGSFEAAVEKAARIAGDSDSVAAICGMLLGAAGGMEALPAAWLEVLPQRDRIEATVASLLALPAGGGE